MCCVRVANRRVSSVYVCVLSVCRTYWGMCVRVTNAYAANVSLGSLCVCVVVFLPTSLPLHAWCCGSQPVGQEGPPGASSMIMWGTPDLDDSEVII